ncbi:MAG: 50S ribosomal protein L13 [Patescibacteria group bacterium]|nr:50S ribosomal protein L13 [Patescibacteria group bacterium]
MTIDATNKSLGRVASAAAKVLLGKHSAGFAKNIVASGEVKIINASKVRLSGQKTKDKEYVRYSGYPGGQKKETYAMLIARKGQKEALRRAILGMLPKNKLQARRIKQLVIEN